MKKRLLFLPFLIIALAGCDPISTDTSTLPPIDNSSSESGGGDSDSHVDPAHTHNFSPNWSFDSHTHWHACSGCDVKGEEAAHTFDDGTVIVQPTETTKGLRQYKCTVCNYYYDEDIDPLGPVTDEFILMNNTLATATEPLRDPYEVRDYLKKNGNYSIGVNHASSSGTHYYYSDAHNKIVEYDPVNNVVIRPSECASDELTKYDSANVDTFGGLVGAINEINSGVKDTSSIVLSNDIEQTADTLLAQYTASKNIELDLNGHKIQAPAEVNKPYGTTKWYTLQFMDKTDTAKVYIHGGTIEANRKMEEDNVQDDSCCLSLVAAKSFRISNVTLKAYHATECIGDLSQYVNANHHDNTKKVYLDNVNMDAPLKAMSIVGGEWHVENSDIKGMVVIEGGRVTLNETTVDASNLINGTYGSMLNYPHGFTNQQLVEEVNVTRLNGNDINTTVDQVLKNYYGSLTFNDAVTIISRRNATYSVPDVEVTGCELKPVVNTANEEQYRNTGYGLRLWDLANNPHEFIKVKIDNVGSETFPLEDGNGFGGTNLTNDQKIIINN